MINKYGVPRISYERRYMIDENACGFPAYCFYAEWLNEMGNAKMLLVGDYLWIKFLALAFEKAYNEIDEEMTNEALVELFSGKKIPSPTEKPLGRLIEVIEKHIGNPIKFDISLYSKELEWFSKVLS